MTEKLDPKIFGLPSRTVLIQRAACEISYVIDRKSRIVMKDARAILEKAKKIKGQSPDALVLLETTAPVCSKSSKFLTDNGIKIVDIS